MLWALRSDSAGSSAITSITIWLATAAVLWLAGAFAEGNIRLALWASALAIEFVAPSLGFWVPGLDRSTSADWDVDGNHLAERCSLFIIIVLGESLLVTGATFAEAAWTPATAAAFAVAFVSSVAMWWIYFDTGAERGSQRIASSSNPGRLGRLAYTYLHIPIVAGIIVAAVADELVLAHPTGQTELKTAIVVIGGPGLFLVGNLLFKATIAKGLPLSHLVGLGLLPLVALATTLLPPLSHLAAVTGVLVIVAVWETLSLRRPRPATVES